MQNGPIKFGFVAPPLPGEIWGHPRAPALGPSFASGAVVDIPVYAAVLPHLCAKCGGGHDLRGRMELISHTPLFAYLGLLFGVLPGVILIAVLTKKTTAIIPLCGSCDDRWTWARRLRMLSIVGPLVLFVAGLAVDGSVPDVGVTLAQVSLVSLLAAPLLTRFLIVRPRTLWPVSIDDRRARLRGASPAMLAALPRG